MTVNEARDIVCGTQPSNDGGKEARAVLVQAVRPLIGLCPSCGSEVDDDEDCPVCDPDSLWMPDRDYSTEEPNE